MLFIVLLTAVIIMSNMVQTPEMERLSTEDNMAQLSWSQRQFTSDLYKALSDESSGNLFFSPFSILSSIAMVYVGAKGNTQQEIAKTLNLSPQSDLNKYFHDIITEYKKPAVDFELHSSNKAYISNVLETLPGYNRALLEDFMTKFSAVDFGNSEVVRQQINKEVEKETHSKIKDLIPTGALNSLTRLVLVNAIYFKGLWQVPFKHRSTRDRDFYVSPNHTVKTPMMFESREFNTAEVANLGATLLKLDYKGKRLSMGILLPNDRYGLKEMEGKLKGFDLLSIDEITTEMKTDVFLPKFKLEESMELEGTLKNLGMASMFSSDCDLSGISDKDELYVSKVIHKAFVEVNEAGTEAAAAAGVVVQTRMMSIRPNPKFMADHPFFFYIIDNVAKIILFAGRFVEPQI